MSIQDADRWISIRHIQHFLAHKAVGSHKFLEKLSKVGFDGFGPIDLDASVPLSMIEGAIPLLSEELATSFIGLKMANDIQPASLGPIGLMAQASTNLGDILKKIALYNGLLSNIGEISLQHHPGAIEVCWSCTAGSDTFQRQAREYVIGSLVVLGRLFLPDDLKLPLCVNFAHSRPDKPADSRYYFDFFKCPVNFDKPASSIIIPIEVLNVQLPHRDCFVKALIERHLEQQLQERHTKYSIEEEVSLLIKNMIVDGTPTKHIVATQLGMSTRTLQRRLDDRGTSYRQLLQSTRLELTLEYLKDKSYSIDFIASRVWFSSRQTFLRWFRDSTGCTPTSYRKNRL